MNRDQPQFLRAGLWMIGAIVSFSLMTIAGRTLADRLDTFEIMLYRSLIGIVLVILLAALTGELGKISRNRLGLHAIRNVSHFTGQNLWFFAITAAPLAQVIALEFTSPLWVLLLSPLFLGERLTLIKIISAVIGFVGVVIVLQPGADFVLGIGAITAALAAIGFAGSMVTTKLLTRTEAVISILFWLTVMQAVFGLITAGYDGDIAWPVADRWPWVFMVAVCGLSAHYSLTQALSLAPASIVVPFDFARLPVIAFIGFVLYSETVDIWVFIGALVIFGGNYLNVWVASRR